MILVYVVCRDRDEAHAIGRGLLERRLAACINSFPIESMYWWQGKIVEDAEQVLIVKTIEGNFTALSAYIRSVHSYEVPAIIRLPTAGADERYLEWLEGETRAQ